VAVCGTQGQVRFLGSLRTVTMVESKRVPVRVRPPPRLGFGGEMAHIEVWVRCPICNKICDTFSEAIKCRDSHPIHSERWAVGKNGAAYRIQEYAAPGSFGSEEWALKKADE